MTMPNSKETIRIFLANDQAVLREAMKCLLEREPNLRIADMAPQATDMPSKITVGKKNLELFLLNFHSAIHSTIQMVRAIKRKWGAIPVLVLDFYSNVDYGVRVMAAGADGYLTQASSPQDLLAAIRKTARGGTWLDVELREKLVAQVKAGFPEKPHSTLTDREYEVLLLIASGNTTSEIAQTLGLSLRTVNSHRARILKKMNLKNDVELARYVFKENLAPLQK